jgi:hypothetical protein
MLQKLVDGLESIMPTGSACPWDDSDILTD